MWPGMSDPKDPPSPARNLTVKSDPVFHALRSLMDRSGTLLGSLGIFLVGGIVVAGIGTWIFSELAETVMAGRTQAFDESVLRWIGARHTPFLDGVMLEITSRLPGVAIRRIDDYGIPATSKEALVFALIGFLTVHGLPATVASCTGAAHASVLGAIVPGAAPLPAANGLLAPTTLVIRTPLPTS